MWFYLHNGIKHQTIRKITKGVDIDALDPQDARLTQPDPSEAPAAVQRCGKRRARTRLHGSIRRRSIGEGYGGPNGGRSDKRTTIGFGRVCGRSTGDIDRESNSGADSGGGEEERGWFWPSTRVRELRQRERKAKGAHGSSALLCYVAVCVVNEGEGRTIKTSLSSNTSVK